MHCTRRPPKISLAQQKDSESFDCLHFLQARVARGLASSAQFISPHQNVNTVTYILGILIAPAPRARRGALCVN